VRLRASQEPVELIEALPGNGKEIIGYGASTKGNVLLQFCGLTRSHIPFIAEVTEELKAFTLSMKRSFPIQLPSSLSVVVPDTRLGNWLK
jgi:hypothetical protein